MIFFSLRISPRYWRWGGLEIRMLYPCEPICPLLPSQLHPAPTWNCSAGCLLMPGSLGQVAWCFLAMDSGRGAGGKKGGCWLLCSGKTHTSHAIRECTSLLGWLICHPSKTAWQLAAHACVQTRSPDQGTEGIHLTEGTPSCLLLLSAEPLQKSCDFFSCLSGFTQKFSSPGKGHGKMNTLMVQATADLHLGWLEWWLRTWQWRRERKRPKGQILIPVAPLQIYCCSLGVKGCAIHFSESKSSGLKAATLAVLRLHTQGAKSLQAKEQQRSACSLHLRWAYRGGGSSPPHRMGTSRKQRWHCTVSLF